MPAIRVRSHAQTSYVILGVKTWFSTKPSVPSIWCLREVKDPTSLHWKCVTYRGLHILAREEQPSVSPSMGCLEYTELRTKASDFFLSLTFLNLHHDRVCQWVLQRPFHLSLSGDHSSLIFQAFIALPTVSFCINLLWRLPTIFILATSLMFSLSSQYEQPIPTFS